MLMVQKTLTDDSSATTDADYDVITLDYTVGNVNVLVGQVDNDGVTSEAAV